jgi:hypothetical protein
MRVTNGILLGCSLLSPVGTVNSVQILKATASNGPGSEVKKPWWVSIGVHRPHTTYRVPVGFYGDELYPGDVVAAPVRPLSILRWKPVRIDVC